MSGVLNSLGKFVESSAVSIVLNLTLMAAMLLSLALGYGNDPHGRHHPGLGHLRGRLPAAAAADRRRAPQRHAAAPAAAAHDARACAASSRSASPASIAGGVTQINIVIGGMIASLQQGAVSLSLLRRPPLRAAAGHRRHRHRRRAAAGHLPAPARRRPRRRHGQPEPLAGVRHAADRAGCRGAGGGAAPDRLRCCSSAAPSAAEDAAQRADALAIFALGLPSFVMIKVFSPAYFAREDTARRCATPPQPDGQHDRLRRAVLRCSAGSASCRTSASPSPPRWAAGSTRACLSHAGRARGISSADARLRRTLPLILLSSAIMGVALWLAADRAGAVAVADREARSCAARRWRPGGHRPAGLRRRDPADGALGLRQLRGFLRRTPPRPERYAGLLRPAPRDNPRRSTQETP